MNARMADDATPIELKVLVERAVRPVHAGMVRKRRMREELLAHLVAIYDEELAGGGGDAASNVAATERFGDPDEVTRELERTVSLLDRYVWFFERYAPDPRESFLRLGVRSLIWSVAVFVPTFGLIAVLEEIRGRPNPWWFVGMVLLHLLIISTVFGACGAFLGYRMACAVGGSADERSTRKALAYGLVSMLFIPALVLYTYVAFTWTYGAEFTDAKFRAYPLLACISAPLTPIVLLLASRQQAEQIRYEREWRELNISA